MYSARFSVFLLTAAAAIAQPGAALKSTPPLLVEKVELPTFTREMVALEWRTGDLIYAYVIIPKSAPELVAKPAVVLYLYSFPSDIDRYRDDEFCKLLTKNGVAAIGFVSALTGHRYHDRPMKEWFISELPEALQTSVEDVSQMINYLTTRSDVDSTRVGMVGEGSGGAITILAAVQDKRIRAIDLLDPWGDWPAWFKSSTLIPEDERAAYNKPEFLTRLTSLEPAECLRHLTIPIRLEYLQPGNVTPEATKQRMQSSAPLQTVRPDRESAIAEIRATQGMKVLDWIQLKVRDLPAGGRSLK